MGKRYKDPGAKCPWYDSEEPSKIYCEGFRMDGFSDRKWIHLAFEDAKEKKIYKHSVCRHGWENCPLAWMRMTINRK